jgi:hypothetical protein
VVERRTTIPILANVLLSAKDGALTLKATDLDLEITEKTAAEVSQPGATTLPAHTLYDIVRKLPEGAQVSLEATGDAGQLTLRSGRSRFNLSSLPESDAIRHLFRRDALLSQRHLSPHARRRRPAHAPGRRDRRPSSGAAGASRP